jgi:enoyl-CoA hydratase/carnithine racemase
LSDQNHLLQSIDMHVLTLQLNRPARKNALTRELCADLRSALQTAAENPDVRVVLLAGGSDAFCSGNDVSEFSSPPPPGDDPGLLLARELACFPKVLVAAVNGPAIGVGLALLLHCDVVVASASASLRAPFVTLGIPPQFGMSVLLPRRVGHALAVDMLLRARPLSGALARDAGLVTHLAPEADALTEAKAHAIELALQAPAATRATKALMSHALRSTTLAAIDAEAAAFVEARSRPEMLEAVMAFMQRRSPDFERFA